MIEIGPNLKEIYDRILKDVYNGSYGSLNVLSSLENIIGKDINLEEISDTLRPFIPSHYRFIDSIRGLDDNTQCRIIVDNISGYSLSITLKQWKDLYNLYYRIERKLEQIK